MVDFFEMALFIFVSLASTLNYGFSVLVIKWLTFLTGLLIAKLNCHLKTWENFYHVLSRYSSYFRLPLIQIITNCFMHYIYFIQFLQILLSNMVYADDDESVLEAEVCLFHLPNVSQLNLFMKINACCFLLTVLLQEDGSLPDRDQVQFYSWYLCLWRHTILDTGLFCSSYWLYHAGSEASFSFITFSWIRGCRRWGMHIDFIVFSWVWLWAFCHRIRLTIICI